ncbi:RVT_3 domain-containing protein [Cephalotus follicularis]|uniref:RVT_3 domain-containing protein n=1 Tax=Cephalotus follicularis TaxID=3775 RepID=A0A1Q3CLK2_CEPFO|nr:RVT_3 domain-containing protein [Cephalotus follicularis]
MVQRVKAWAGRTGMVMRDRHGTVLMDATLKTQQTRDPPTVEALAILEAMKLVLLKVWRNIVVESDAGVVLNEIRADQPSLTLYGNMIEEIKSLAKSFLSCHFSWINRVGNKVAHELAKVACSLETTCVWLDWITMFLSPVIIANSAGI